MNETLNTITELKDNITAHYIYELALLSLTMFSIAYTNPELFSDDLVDILKGRYLDVICDDLLGCPDVFGEQ